MEKASHVLKSGLGPLWTLVIAWFGLFMGSFLRLDAMSQHDHLDQAAAYILKLRHGIERLKQRKESEASSGINQATDENGRLGFKLPVIEVRHQEPNLEVLLISGLEKRFAFHEVIGILEEEGAEVVNASFSVVGNKVFYTIHSQAFSSRIGLEASRVSERLQELIR
ncbi:hypothetical protein HPP92_004484 [Vanilla planifolia]|uniref:Uncharacterized protein n=1 Tax=Vanilla planifolia TaxID=51239 RepID=A0A835RJJ8_VANPL|nr:hypothetical protein HPP92_004859 [Vanilla planifolia]KAG0493490.1 hypothetical protein HPP92_004484 [Vanilla planifolia]